MKQLSCLLLLCSCDTFYHTWFLKILLNIMLIYLFGKKNCTFVYFLILQVYFNSQTNYEKNNEIWLIVNRL